MGEQVKGSAKGRTLGATSCIPGSEGSATGVTTTGLILSNQV